MRSPLLLISCLLATLAVAACSPPAPPVAPSLPASQSPSGPPAQKVTEQQFATAYAQAAAKFEERNARSAMVMTLPGTRLSFDGSGAVQSQTDTSAGVKEFICPRPVGASVSCFSKSADGSWSGEREATTLPSTVSTILGASIVNTLQDVTYSGSQLAGGEGKLTHEVRDIDGARVLTLVARVPKLTSSSPASPSPASPSPALASKKPDPAVPTEATVSAIFDSQKFSLVVTYVTEGKEHSEVLAVAQRASVPAIALPSPPASSR